MASFTELETSPEDKNNCDQYGQILPIRREIQIS
ncbi:MAG: hypothetical protein JWQ66_454 [Mucilaginibacter sp.]|nr:hypothetical protein [Mucilaginibacter sp.]